MIHGQQSFKEVDSVSYQLYLDKDWSKLVQYGQDAEAKGYDYFYLNLRIGIAFFNLKDYKTSLIYLEKAHEDNSYSDVVKEYLFWDNYYLFKEKQAIMWYNQLDDSIQERIGYSKPKFINGLYIGGGKKTSQNPDIASNVSYLTINLDHHLGGRLDLKHGYLLSTQKLNWGDFTQHQYFIIPAYTIKSGLVASIALHGASYTSSLNYNNEWVYHSAPPQNMPGPGSVFTDTLKYASYKIEGSYHENDLLVQPSLTKTWSKFVLSPYFSYYYSNHQPGFTEHKKDSVILTDRMGQNIIDKRVEVSDTVNIPANSIATQFGIGSKFFVKMGSLTLGADAKIQSYFGTHSLFFLPSFNLDLAKKIHFSGYYFNKKGYVLGLFGGTQLINTFDDVKKLNFTMSFDIGKSSLYITYQHENVLDKLSYLSYSMNSIFMGLQIKF